jgi:hypothetical protein
LIEVATKRLRSLSGLAHRHERPVTVIRNAFADQQLQPFDHELKFDDFGKLPHSG